MAIGKFIPKQGYPTSAWGQTRVTCGDLFGTSNYQAGGDAFVPTPFFPGGSIEKIEMSAGGYSTSNNYFGRVSYPANSFSTTEPYSPNFGQTGSTANSTNAPIFKVYIAGNSAEVANNTNLAAEIFPCVTVFGG